MTLIDIENMPFADLKAKRAELIEAASLADIRDVAVRFVDARTDAKQRDEKLSEQGRTITALNDALDARVTELRDAAKSTAELTAQLATADATIQSLRESLAKSQAECGVLATERDAAVQLAKARRVGLAAVMTTISPLLAAEG